MYHGILKSLPPPRIRTAMNRAARGGDEVPVGPDAIDPPARVVHSLGRTADDRGTATVPSSSAVRGKARADWWDYTSF